MQAVLPFFNASLMVPHWIEFDLAARNTPGLSLRRDVQLAYSLPSTQLVALTRNMRLAAMNFLPAAHAGRRVD